MATVETGHSGRFDSRHEAGAARQLAQLCVFKYFVGVREELPAGAGAAGDPWRAGLARECTLGGAATTWVAMPGAAVHAEEQCATVLQPEPERRTVGVGDRKPLDRQAAAVCLQRARRRAARRRPSNNTCPITLEELCPAHRRADQPLFRYVDAAGVLTAIQARALADYGLAAGELIHPLSRTRLNACEVLRLEHTLVRAGFAKYAGLAAQLSESVTTSSPAGSGGAGELITCHVDSHAHRVRRRGSSRRQRRQRLRTSAALIIRTL